MIQNLIMAQNLMIVAIVAFAMGLAGFKAWLRHQRAQHGLEMIKSYVDQGKEPPPQLLEALQKPGSDQFAERWGRQPERLWIPFFLFAGLSAGFVVMAIFGTDRHEATDFAARTPFIFVSLVMAGWAPGFFVNPLPSKARES